ncbi:MAG TPA: hypothetical protein VGK82_14165 [Pyrinomonadaceae bacterium]
MDRGLLLFDGFLKLIELRVLSFEFCFKHSHAFRNISFLRVCGCEGEEKQG